MSDQHSDRDAEATAGAYSLKLSQAENGIVYASGIGISATPGICAKPDLIVKAEFVEVLPDGFVRIKAEAFT